MTLKRFGPFRELLNGATAGAMPAPRLRAWLDEALVPEVKT